MGAHKLSYHFPFLPSYKEINSVHTGLPNRREAGNEYRYGFQGQEKDDEIKGEGNSVNYKYRMHDVRIGRFFAVDPLTSKYPHYSPYSFSGNKVIHAIELEGLEEARINEYNEFTWGPLNVTMLDNTESKSINEITNNEYIEESFTNACTNSLTFISLLQAQDFYNNVTIEADYTNSGAYTKSTPNYNENGTTYFSETTIYIGVLAGPSIVGKLTWELTNSKNYLNGAYSELIDKAYYNKDFTKADYIKEASLIESEANFNEIIVKAEIFDSRFKGKYKFKAKGAQKEYLKQFNGMTIEELIENKDNIINATSNYLTREGSNTLKNYEDEFEIIRDE